MRQEKVGDEWVKNAADKFRNKQRATNIHAVGFLEKRVRIEDEILLNSLKFLVCPARIERATPSLEGWCSIQLSYGHVEIESKRAISNLRE